MSIPDAIPQLEEAKATADNVLVAAVTFYRRAFIVVVVAFLILVGTVIYDGATLNAINQRGLKNQVILSCVVKSQNGIIKDVPLAFSGDTNPKDYSKEHSCQLPK